MNRVCSKVTHNNKNAGLCHQAQQTRQRSIGRARCRSHSLAMSNAVDAMRTQSQEQLRTSTAKHVLILRKPYHADILQTHSSVRHGYRRVAAARRCTVVVAAKMTSNPIIKQVHSVLCTIIHS